VNRITLLQIFTLGLVATASNASCVKAISHNQDKAAIEAVEFAKAGIIDRDYEFASKLLALDTQKGTSASKLENVIGKMHTVGWPNSIEAVSYEPIPGQRAMRIYLEGENATENFHYLFVMQGDSDAGYRVFDIFRLLEPIPASASIRPLPVQRTTN